MTAFDGRLVPDGFHFGVATAGSQVEGGYNVPGGPANNWLWWEHAGRAVAPGPEANFWREPEAMLDRTAKLGCDTVGLTVEWARIEPQAGAVDRSALDRYGEILAACHDRGLEPIVTLCDAAHPWWLGEEFWLTPGSPDRFAEHVRGVMAALAGSCRRWVTINRPNALAAGGWVLGQYPPGRRLAVSDAMAVADNLLAAHVLAYEVVRSIQPDAEVAINTACLPAYELDRLFTDVLCARSQGIEVGEFDAWVDQRRADYDAAFPPRSAADRWIRRALATVSPYGTGPVGVAHPVRSRFRRNVPGRALRAAADSAHARPLDAAGLGWAEPPADRAKARTERWVARGRWSIPDPAGLACCVGQGALAPGLPLRVVDGGTPAIGSAGGPKDLRGRLTAVVDALAVGVPLDAYLHAGLVDTDDGPSGYGTLISGLRAGDRSVLGRR